MVGSSYMQFSKPLLCYKAKAKLDFLSKIYVFRKLSSTHFVFRYYTFTLLFEQIQHCDIDNPNVSCIQTVLSFIYGNCTFMGKIVVFCCIHSHVDVYISKRFVFHSFCCHFHENFKGV